MFRKSTITITLAAAAFVAVGSASAPAEAFDLFDDWHCVVEPVHCMVDEATPDRDRGPVEEETPRNEGAVGGAGGLGIGGIVVPVPDSPSLDVGGVSTEPPGTVIRPELPDDVLDAITDPVVDLPAVELPTLEDPEGPETSEPPAAPEAPEDPAAPPAPAAPVTPAAPEVGPGTASSEQGRAVAPAQVEAPTPVTPERVARETTPTTSVASQDVSTQDQADESADSAEALITTNAGTDTASSFDPMIAALFGMLGALALMLFVFAGFAAGRRRS